MSTSYTSLEWVNQKLFSLCKMSHSSQLLPEVLTPVLAFRSQSPVMGASSSGAVTVLVTAVSLHQSPGRPWCWFMGEGLLWVNAPSSQGGGGAGALLHKTAPKIRKDYGGKCSPISSQMAWCCTISSLLTHKAGLLSGKDSR